MSAPRTAGSARRDPRTQRLLSAPIVPTLLRLGLPNVLVMLAQASIGLIETYFVGKLGTDALAGMALVFPVVMLMHMTSAGAMGGGIASAVGRALGAGRRADANALVLHAVLIAVGFGLLFMAVVLPGGRWLYSSMGGTGAALTAALTYSNWVFAGALLVWVFNALASVLRGTGNMTLPAWVTVGGLVALVPLSPLLIFGWGPLPGMGIAGGAAALLLYYFAGCCVFSAYLCSNRSLLRPTLRGFRLRRPLLADILRVGLIGMVSTLATNLTVAIATSLVGRFGTAAIAGFGTAARLEYLLAPLVFGLGAPLLSMVATCMGAGLHERALRAAWAGAALAFALTEAIGLLAALFPQAWLSLFASDPAILDAGSRYLRIAGPCYGFLGLGLVLYFASQGAGRLRWPVMGNAVRLVLVASGGWAVLALDGGLAQLFAVLALALVVYGLIIASAVAGGSWFGPLGWPRTLAGLLQRLEATRHCATGR
ncbi:MAG: MATE family efflux transporter [Xanthomonadaceae bacterium]|mgnify:FL=1|nr:MATE family efflux transporter [Xanthomonadaceae bacterium]